MPPARRVEVEVEGRLLSLSNLEKVFYPQARFTKGQVIEFYSRAAPAVLPHLRGRALTMKRYPDGVQGQHFYEKQRPSHAPEWIRTARIATPGGDRAETDFVLADDLPTLVWLANMADLELHASLSLAAAPGVPTVVAFDLDPGAPATVVECAQVALILRDLLAGIGLSCYAKTSGSKGMQVYVPLNTGEAGYEQTKPFARAVAEAIERHHPELVTSNMRKSLRPGKVFIDWSQNDRHKTTVCVYSLRARERPTVSTPLLWEEVEAGARAEPGTLDFDAGEVLDRISEHGDLFAGVLSERQSLPG